MKVNFSIFPKKNADVYFYSSYFFNRIVHNLAYFDVNSWR